MATDSATAPALSRLSATDVGRDGPDQIGVEAAMVRARWPTTTGSCRSTARSASRYWIIRVRPPARDRLLNPHPSVPATMWRAERRAAGRGPNSCCTRLMFALPLVGWGCCRRQATRVRSSSGRCTCVHHHAEVAAVAAAEEGDTRSSPICSFLTFRPLRGD